MLEKWKNYYQTLQNYQWKILEKTMFGYLNFQKRCMIKRDVINMVMEKRRLRGKLNSKMVESKKVTHRFLNDRNIPHENILKIFAQK
ncbi:hypothetical protein Bhyg_00632 [Pseudolycoriella hygida]|uniref:Uncharacterized protein n=1 Tax=Pseudolycoriella hygida TaxID=35572 RepID=A0A9Q0N9D8_9DIPT|nr:hypothetical protein Bhyg_00632 [Pseudolycoriella hygida]